MKKLIWLLYVISLSLFADHFENIDDYFQKNALVMLLIHPSDGKIVKANEAAAKFYGYSILELEKMSIKDINTFTKEQVQQEMQNAKKENRNYFIFRHRLHNKQTKRVEVYSRPILYNNQRVLYSIIQDVTNLELAQKEIAHYSKTLEEQVDIKSQEIVQKEIDKKNLFVFGFVVQLIIILLLYINISRRKEAEKELAHSLKRVESSKKQLEHIINSFPIPIIKADSTFTTVEYFNKSFQELFGWEKNDIKTTKDWVLKAYPNEIYRQKTFIKWDELVDETKILGLQTSKRAIEVEITCKNGETKLCQLWYHENYSDIYGIFYDITKQTQLEQENLEQQKLLLTQAKIAAVGEMLGNIAHQWRQPLSSISSHVSGLKVQMAFGQALCPSDIEECADNIIKKVNYLSATIDDFKNFFTSDTQNNAPFNIKDTIDKLYSLIKDSLKNNYIQCYIDAEDVSVNYNENKLIQCLMNICNNAKDAMVLNEIKSDQRKLFIKLQVKDDMVQIKIKDSGGGVNEDVIDKIFEPYFTTKHKSIGTGIGLYMSYQLITSSFKGTIKVKNKEYTYQGKNLKGAQFTVEFPMKNKEKIKE